MHFSVVVLAVLQTLVYSIPFQAVLNLPSQIELGEDVVCQVTLSNPTDYDFFLFYRATPLDKRISNIFSITMNGSRVPYDGPFFKRSAVNKQSEGTEIRAHNSITASVDLSSIYSFNKRSRYTVSLSSQIYFLKDGDSVISFGQLQSAPVEFKRYGDDFAIGKNTLGEKHRLVERHFSTTELNQFAHKEGTPEPVKFGGTFIPQESSQGSTAWSDAYQGIIKGQEEMASHPEHYEHWFGLPPSGTPKPWRNVLSSIQSAMEAKQFLLYLHGGYCEPGDYAYTYMGGHVIYLCDRYFVSPATGYDSKLGTLVHELSHAVAYTEDFEYGQEDCLYLARKFPIIAIMNADNYEYYIESLN